MIKKLGKPLALILALTMILARGFSASAAGTPSEKEEVVYGILDANGGVGEIFVVNAFNGGKITDYGDYTAVENLTTAEQIGKKDGEITINATAARLYYKGTLSTKALPWKILVRYFLGGVEITAMELAGKSGALKIEITVEKNPDVNETFFNNYALQVSLSLDTKICGNISAAGATIADAGSEKQISYTVLPGKGAEFTVTADVRNFEMDAISINGIRLALDIDVDVTQFTEEISQFIDAIDDLDGGAGDLLEGAEKLAEGMSRYVAGIAAFKNGISRLSGGIGDLNAGTAALSSGLAALSAQNESLVNGAQSILQSIFAAADQQLSSAYPGLPVLTPDNYAAILENIPELAAIKAQLDGAVEFAAGIKSYTDGVSQLSLGASDLAGGAAGLESSVSKLAASANEIYSAGAELNAAIGELRGGLASYKAGTGEMKNGAAGVDAEIAEKIDEILEGITGSGDEVVSFVSDKNTNVASVQFVLKTQAIRVEETEDTPVQEPVRLNFWQRLLKLFGLYD